ncbi:MAG: aminofutalosine synthase MqnE [Perlabentimonas sp.]
MYQNTNTKQLLSDINLGDIKPLVDKVLAGERISTDDALVLFEQAEIGLLGILSNHVAQKKNGDRVFFNRNFHIEPTNICVHNCSFCSYRRELGQEGSWEMSLNDIKNTVRKFKDKNPTEVHITGGVHPEWDINYYGKLIATIKEEMPQIHVKAFSAVELDYVISKANLPLRDGVKILKGYGLDSIPGGGAEISNQEIRKKICGSKSSWPQWLRVHEAAHQEGLTSNATMLYGHIENYAHRVEHMHEIRLLQDKTGGFNCFIPLKFKSSNNRLGTVGETNTLDDLRTYAVARIFFDNIQHIKAYWPMLGKDNARMLLDFGVDDIDGTIDESTKIYSMAGSEEQNPNMTVDEVCRLIRSANKKPAERDSLYNTIFTY